jgi:hypothetical protein
MNVTVLILIAMSWLGAEPPEVALRDLTARPLDYSGKLVQTSGNVSIGFEYFILCVETCETGSTWLEYGRGPKKQPAIWCCGDLVPRDPLKLIQDSQFKLFDRYLRAKEPLTATITGRFDACPSGPCFGHLGISSHSRLVIQSVQKFTLIHVH